MYTRYVQYALFLLACCFRTAEFFFSRFRLRSKQGAHRYITMHAWILAELRGGALRRKVAELALLVKGLRSASLSRVRAWKPPILLYSS